MSSPTPVLDPERVETRPTVGFIGLGNMGSGMTFNLQAAGFPWWSPISDASRRTR